MVRSGAIAFGQGAQLDRVRRPGLFDVAFRLGANRWNGSGPPQLVVRRIFETPDGYAASPRAPRRRVAGRGGRPGAPRRARSSRSSGSLERAAVAAPARRVGDVPGAARGRGRRAAPGGLAGSSSRPTTIRSMEQVLSGPGGAPPRGSSTSSSPRSASTTRRSTATCSSARSCTPAPPTRATSAEAARTSSCTPRRRPHSRGAADGLAHRRRRAAARRRRGHGRDDRAGAGRVRRGDRPARRGRHEADADQVPEPRAGPGRELPQDDRRDGARTSASSSSSSRIGCTTCGRSSTWASRSRSRRRARRSRCTRPLAHRLGIHQIKWELEDLAFQTLHPRKYTEIEAMVAAAAEPTARADVAEACRVLEGRARRRRTSAPSSPVARSTSTRSTRRW